MKAISLDDGTQLDLDTTEGRYRYVAHFLNQHGAHPEIWSALISLYEAANAALMGGEAVPSNGVVGGG